MKELTYIEREIIRLLADGLTLKEMSLMLHNQESTIDSYRYRLFRKLKVKNAPHCVAWAFRNKILTVTP